LGKPEQEEKDGLSSLGREKDRVLTTQKKLRQGAGVFNI
jgi:hypothetical protein